MIRKSILEAAIKRGFLAESKNGDRIDLALGPLGSEVKRNLISEWMRDRKCFRCEAKSMDERSGKKGRMQGGSGYGRSGNGMGRDPYGYGGPTHLVGVGGYPGYLYPILIAWVLTALGHMGMWVTGKSRVLLPLGTQGYPAPEIP